jgi:hypothetical protein
LQDPAIRDVFDLFTEMVESFHEKATGTAGRV